MRYFLGFLAAVGLVVLVFVLVLRGLGGGKQSVETKLTDYTATDTVMQLTVDGRVVADQEHQAVRVTVGRFENKIEIIRGYQNQIVEVKTYPNNEEAYGTFLRALHLLGYTKGDTDAKKGDERGVCPTGQRYIFEIVTGSASVQRFWKTSCGSGTFKGNSSEVRSLFRAQIPEYSKTTSKLEL